MARYRAQAVETHALRELRATFLEEPEDETPPISGRCTKIENETTRRCRIARFRKATTVTPLQCIGLPVFLFRSQQGKFPSQTCEHSRVVPLTEWLPKRSRFCSCAFGLSRFHTYQRRGF